MTKLTISNETLVAAVKSAAICMKDTFVLSVSNKDVGSGLFQGSLGCCNGSTQSSIFIGVKADEDACGEYVFGKEFGQIVQTLAAYDDGNFIIKRKEDGNCTISCGGAAVPVPVLASAAGIQVSDMTGSVVAELDAAVFKDAVARGGSSFDANAGGAYEALRNAISIRTENAGEQYFLRFTSSDGVKASSARAVVKKQAGMENELSLSVNATVFTKIASVAKSEAVTLYMSNKQLIIQDGYDLYIIVPNAAEFPAGISQLLLTKPEKNYSFKVVKKKLLSSIDVALLGAGTGKSKRKACVSVEDGKLTVQNAGGSCRSKLETTEISGAVQMGLNADKLKSLLAHMGEDILFYGQGAVSPVYISDGVENAMCFLAPASFTDEPEEDAGSEETDAEKDASEE